MIEMDDVGDGFLYGGFLIGCVFLVIYLVWSKPEIEKCAQSGANGGIMVRTADGKDVCVDKAAVIPKGK